MTVSIIAARSNKNVIGKGTEIPWRIRGEQELFKRITMNGTLIMGRVTFESIGRPLPGRTTIIVTRRKDYQQEGCQVANSLDLALEMAHQSGKPIFITGGGEIYRQAISKADIVHLTTINAEINGDVFFPTFPTDEFELVAEEFFQSNIDYVYQQFKRIN
jgi:dihydrofolate reductase